VSFADRFLAWLVTGPAGRLFAFLADLSIAWLRWAVSGIGRAISKLRRRDEDGGHRAR
jgi:hypothetical protein